MASNTKDPVLVILQLSGGNDALNTVIPYSNPLYHDNRPKVGIPEDQVLPINDSIGFHPAMGPIKKLYDEGKVAIIQGIGYPKPSRSHFRSMDIWHTCEPDEGRRRGLGGPGHSRYRPPEGQCADWRQLRSWSAAGSGCSWRTSGLGGQPGDLRRPHRHRGRGPAHSWPWRRSPAPTRRCSAKVRCCRTSPRRVWMP